ncbi:ATP-dependent DNA helicase [Vulcaniibacterium tengchongense]|uniref:ATP-dependent DNA helicase DinG n=1 Tax=Vulcaniibacterium tengchongense TaxID=1273429 RepID=A0A3N4V2I4_9GAMM|nr:ATP-dependent DNA helicase [Vulcaniibacterium tengchongense]RPE75445.1 ATP-dependent DNA helicase DinG [Vulcaniibacterium tengchongense]
MPGSRLGEASRTALADGGAFARELPGFVVRPMQQDLAEAIGEAIETRGTLLAEAGTGTGKTFAYLVPALLSGSKTIVSTGTRALQDQLYHRDLPRVRDALGVGLKTALLKGRANYLCHYRMRQAQGEPRFASREMAAQFQRIVAWSGRTRMGDLAELDALPEDSPLLPMVTSTAENCLGGECPFFADCFVVQARQRAQAADIVVVNHHLLLADLALKQEGFGEILPGAQTFVVDEAHQLPELAAQFFGETLSARPLVELARDALAECRQVPSALAAVQAPARALEQAVRALRAAMDELPVRGTRRRAAELAAAEDAFDALAQALHDLHAALQPLAAASPGFDGCAARALEFEGRLQRWRDDGAAAGAEAEDESAADSAAPGAEAEGRAAAGPAAQGPQPEPGQKRRGDESVLWYELSARGFRLSRTPLDVAGPLARHRARSQAAWVFTSATLAVGGRFEHFAGKLGLNLRGEHPPRTLLVPSPFDWQRQALCYLPRGLPDPMMRHYNESLVEKIRPVLEASSGRAFVLFASHRALREAAELLRDGPWPLFVQGEAPRPVLLERFRASGNGVLLGAASFREGVDVAGEALSVVVIDKLPFAAPDDPVFEARLDAIRRGGGNPFRDEQLPQAVIALKQGAGRLIRNENDRGVLVLCDPRLLAKSYGSVFLNSLPPLPKTRRIEDVAAFFQAADPGAAIPDS